MILVEDVVFFADKRPSEKDSYITVKKEMRMKKGIFMATVVLSASMLTSAAFAAGTGGEAIFKAKCSACHPDGGNIMKPTETLKGIKSSKKIINQVRKGGGGMPAFDTKAISDADAKLLADYIIKTFKK
jgi:cytochrome c6